MLPGIKNKFSTKLIFLIGLVFIIPVATALFTLKMTSKASLNRFDRALAQTSEEHKTLIKEIFPRLAPEQIADASSAMRLLREYEERRTFGLFMSLIVISVALAAVVVLLSMLILKRAMLSLGELAGACARVGEGDFDISIKPRSHDEFAGLVSTFGGMAKNLKEITVSRDFYNHAMESLPAAVFTLDEDSKITTWNKKAAQLTSVSAAEITGKLFQTLNDIFGELTKTANTPLFGREFVIRPRCGGQKVVSLSIDRLLDRGGKSVGTIAAFIDISEQKKMEGELVVAKERAEESSRLRSEFLANMSHEIRTPLNGILGLAQLLEEEEKDDEKRSHLARISQCGANLLHIINEILELSKIEAGKMVLHTTVVATEDIIREAVSTIEVECGKKGLDLKVDISPKIPPTLEVDNYKLVQILVNLLGNSLKFTKEGFIRLSGGTYRGSHRGNILFEVKDSGVGIPKDRQPLIFESFVQAQPHLTKTTDGTGLGLAISKKLVELMGGDIWFESEEEKGSVFSFTIESEINRTD